MTPETSNAINEWITEFKTNRIFLLTGMIAIISAYSNYFLFSPGFIILLGDENSFFELGTAICFLISSVFLIYLFAKKRNVFFLILGVMLFMGAGEELSWGQHIIGFETPDKIRQQNVQREFNIHNIEMFNTDKFNGCRKSGVQRLVEINFVFRLICITYGIIIPFCFSTFPFCNKIFTGINLPIAPMSIGIFFILNWLAYKTVLFFAEKNQPLPYYETSTEIFEFIASFIWLLIGLYFLSHQKNKIRVKVT